jgi:enoyl-CoA hydratase/carnithine racemase
VISHNSENATVRIEIDAGTRIATVVLQRPEAMNAISRRLATELSAACSELSEAPEIRVVIVTGEGGRAFSAGADLRERGGLSATERTEHTHLIETAVEAVAALPMPTIAAIRGYALAGGAELALACDIRIASDDATLGFPEVKVGIFPGAGGVIRLPRLVGDGIARDLLFTGRTIAATDAQQIGLVDRVVRNDELASAVQSFAESVASNAPLAVRAIKQALRRNVGQPHDSAQEITRDLRMALDATDDYEEGLRAFAERRQPAFSGR